MKKSEFLTELTDIAAQLDDLFERYGRREEIVSIFLAGVMEEAEEGERYIKAVYGYNIYDDLEMKEMLSFIKESYEKGGYDPELGGFDVSMN